MAAVGQWRDEFERRRRLGCGSGRGGKHGRRESIYGQRARAAPSDAGARHGARSAGAGERTERVSSGGARRGADAQDQRRGGDARAWTDHGNGHGRSAPPRQPSLEVAHTQVVGRAERASRARRLLPAKDATISTRRRHSLLERSVVGCAQCLACLSPCAQGFLVLLQGERLRRGATLGQRVDRVGV